jgi:hypothetical protein
MIKYSSAYELKDYTGVQIVVRWNFVQKDLVVFLKSWTTLQI